MPGYDARMPIEFPPFKPRPDSAPEPVPARAPPATQQITAEPDFRSAVGAVRVRAPSNRVEPPRRLPKPVPRSSEADERAVLEELLLEPLEPDAIESGDTLVYRAPGLQDSVWRRLRRGSFRVGAELDLHGYNREAARQEVALFLAACQERNLRCLRIIHGKGLGSPNTGPVIKTLLDGWLRKRKEVLAFCSARPHDGGTGAVYVLLRAQHERPPRLLGN